MSDISQRFEEIDNLLDDQRNEQAYGLLRQMSTVDPVHKYQVMWRLARSCFQSSAELPSNNPKRKDLLYKGKECAHEALQLNDNDFNGLKWAAVVHGSLDEFLSMKARIENGHTFKGYLDKAIALQPKDFSLLHMRGRFSYSVAGLSWIERNFASTFFETPPTATYQDAVNDLLEVNRIKPDWIDNLFYLAKSYMRQGDKANAAKYLKSASNVQPSDDADREVLKEVTQLMKKYK
ncbi:regulator of microtubule dynamics protein 1 [Ditylenchus destructor]|nr:regulator of microtubule dynamics protein 1 [Ditylenchus destructor]